MPSRTVRRRSPPAAPQSSARPFQLADASAFEARCDGLLAYAAPSERDDDRARAIAEAAVAETLPGTWVVTPLGPGARDYRIAPASGRAVPLARAWTLARQLEAHRDVADAEPAVVQPGIEPPLELAEDFPTAQAFPRGSRDEAPLPCAGRHDWSLDLCRVREAWALTPPTPAGRARGEGIVVGHPDTGYTRHAEIWDSPPRLRIAESHDFVLRRVDAIDPLEEGNPGHGTATGSVIMSTDGNGTMPFVAGIAPAATLLPLRVTPKVVIIAFDRLAEAIHYAIDKGCHVISMSLGGPVRSRTLERAIDRAVANGIVVLAAAGNVWPFVVYPARFDTVIACAACNCERKVWSRSASGPAVDVTAPGESVWVARAGRNAGPDDDGVAVGSGTSFAVATTAGACALWLAFHDRAALVARYGAAQVPAVFKEVLMTSGVQVPAGWNTRRHGAGILDVERLLKAPLPDTAPASGMQLRSAARPRAESDVDLLTEYFPGVEPAEVRRGLVRWLATTDGELPALMATLGDEVLFHVATNADVRRAILRGGGAKKRGRDIAAAGLTAAVRGTSSAGATRPAGAARFVREASPALQQRVR